MPLTPLGLIRRNNTVVNFLEAIEAQQVWSLTWSTTAGFPNIKPLMVAQPCSFMFAHLLLVSGRISDPSGESVLKPPQPLPRPKPPVSCKQGCFLGRSPDLTLPHFSTWADFLCVCVCVSPPHPSINLLTCLSFTSLKPLLCLEMMAGPQPGQWHLHIITDC